VGQEQYPEGISGKIKITTMILEAVTGELVTLGSFYMTWKRKRRPGNREGLKNQ